MLRTPIVTPLGKVELKLNGQSLDYSSDELKIADIYKEQMKSRMIGIKYLKDIKKTDKIVLTLDQSVGNFEFDGDEGYYGSISVKNGVKLGLSLLFDWDSYDDDFGIDYFDDGIIINPFRDFSAQITFFAVWGDENISDIDISESMYV
ncbi:hypothetical protein Q2T76_03020 [Lactobacillus sp. YT155]|uniref:hypothetical protein n=1 Tax=Lactobacillus sp. YT155 TaxID=3060955 RepID=UPI00265D817A|nr:hypothetical protein [Lactobacillus sp. YT155]MDO1605024.1 hypothetical protein [Lactobacillus sp. YT155]